MHPIPEDRKSPSFRAAVGAGLAVLVAAGIVFFGPTPGRESASSAPARGPGTAGAPAPLRLEPAPPVAAELARQRGHPVLWYMCGPLVPYESDLPELNRLQRAFAASGLEVIGLYQGPRTPELEALLANCEVDWRVFHDAPGSAMGEWKQRLSASYFPRVVLLDASGNRLHAGSAWGLAKTLEKHLGAPAAVPRAVLAEVRGRLLHAGRPASEFTAEPAKFGPFYDESTARVEQRDFKVAYDPRTGEFRILNLPAGKWGVYITCGPFWHNFHTFSAAGRVPRPVELTLSRRIYLRKPVDTGKDVASGADLFLPSPVNFEWDPVPGADTYAISARRRRLDVPESAWEALKLGPVKDPRIEFETEEGFQYEFGMQALGPTGTIAHLRIYQDGLGNTFRFQRGEPRVEKEGR